MQPTEPGPTGVFNPEGVETKAAGKFDPFRVGTNIAHVSGGFTARLLISFPFGEIFWTAVKILSCLLRLL